MLGIKPIQDQAIVVSNMIRSTKIYEQHNNPVWSIDQNIEIVTRLLVREDMKSILFGKLCEDTVEELSDVLFNVVYPTYERPRSISSD